MIFFLIRSFLRVFFEIFLSINKAVYLAYEVNSSSYELRVAITSVHIDVNISEITVSVKVI